MARKTDYWHGPMGAKVPVIDDFNWSDHVTPTIETADGKIEVSYGLVPRKWEDHPHGSLKGSKPFEAVDFPKLIDLSDTSALDALIAEQDATESSMQHVRRKGDNGNIIPSLDQDGYGYCWMHSGTMALILTRVRDGQPYVRLSAFGPACKEKHFADQGGWGARGLELLQTIGAPPVSVWPEKSTNRSLDNAGTWAEAANYKVSEGWVDLANPVYDRTLTQAQAFTALFSSCCVIADFNWWSHSVCILRVVRIEAGRYGLLGINSWTDSYGDKGEFVVSGSRMNLDGGSAVRAATLALPKAA